MIRPWGIITQYPPDQSMRAVMLMLRIQQKELHIWWANLRDFDSDIPALQSVLSPYEKERANRFRFLRDANNYIICHGIFRMLLGSYVGQSPTTLNFTYGPYGKPELRGDCCGAGIHFNLSHSGDLAFYGFTYACPIGVDVEYLSPIPHFETLAMEFFSTREVEGLMALPREYQMRHFFGLWTRKEALLKATGDGLGSGQPIRRDASLFESKASALMDRPEPFGVFTEWQTRSFSPLPGYLAAVAFKEPDLDLTYRNVVTSYLEEFSYFRR